MFGSSVAPWAGVQGALTLAPLYFLCSVLRVRRSTKNTKKRVVVVVRCDFLDRSWSERKSTKAEN
jgi:hypothetical protein